MDRPETSANRMRDLPCQGLERLYDLLIAENERRDTLAREGQAPDRAAG